MNTLSSTSLASTSEAWLKSRENGDEFWPLVYQVLRTYRESQSAREVRSTLDRVHLHDDTAIRNHKAKELRRVLIMSYRRHLVRLVQINHVLVESDTDPVPEINLFRKGCDPEPYLFHNKVLQNILDRERLRHLFSGPFAAALNGLSEEPDNSIIDPRRMERLRSACSNLAKQDAQPLRALSDQLVPYAPDQIPLGKEVRHLVGRIAEFIGDPHVTDLEALTNHRLATLAMLYAELPPCGESERSSHTWGKMKHVLDSLQMRGPRDRAKSRLLHQDWIKVFLTFPLFHPRTQIVRRLVPSAEAKRVTKEYLEVVQRLAHLEWRSDEVPYTAWQNALATLTKELGCLEEQIVKTEELLDTAVGQVQHVKPQFRSVYSSTLAGLHDDFERLTSCEIIADRLDKILKNIMKIVEASENSNRVSDAEWDQVFQACLIRVHKIIYESPPHQRPTPEVLEDLERFRMGLLRSIEEGGYCEIGREQLLGKRLMDVTRSHFELQDASHASTDTWEGLVIKDVSEPGYLQRRTNTVMRPARVVV